MYPKFYYGGHYDFDYNQYLSLKSNNQFKKSISFNFYSNARTCLQNILLKIGTNNKILIPDYLCGDATIDPIEKSKWNYTTYRIEKNFSIEFSQFKSLINTEITAILIVNYFGIYNNLNLINYLKINNPEIITIYDTVQYPWFFLDVNNNKFNSNFSKNIDYAFTSFNKSFPVPDGAIVYCKNNKMIKPKKSLKSNDDFWIRTANKKFEFLSQKREKIMEFEYLNNFIKIDDEYNNKFNYDISNLTLKILNKLNLKSIALRRKSNFAFINSLVKNKLKINLKSVPMFYPFICKNKVKYLRKELIKRKIFLPIHWPMDKRVKKMCSDQGLFLYNNQISLVIDQRMDKIKIVQMLNMINKILKSKQFNI